MEIKMTKLQFKKKSLVCQLLNCVRLFATPLTAARRAPLSMGFSRQEPWRGAAINLCDKLMVGIQ